MSRVAVVTGGIGGLGTAMCKALVEQGRKAVAVDYSGLSAEVVDKWKADRKAEGLDIPVYLADV
ncbi:MAG: SDR family NAD(P)-dependent oxidoreductase, partial [Candidatus Competibacteraceae bacterium]|nr:SDR family NAD(P)-dependent oxidoreductase [Candidatus Competibacteraceae bacterium]